MTESTPFDHIVIPRLTGFRMSGEPTIQDIYAAMTTDKARNGEYRRGCCARR